MKTIFAKYNSERLPKFQIVTKIVADNDGQKYAIKEALCDEAKEHIDDIYKNYELLKSTYNINLVKPTKIENGLSFEMAKGNSLENILLDSMGKNDSERFEKYVDKFLDFVDGMVCEQNVLFQPSQEFEDVFGSWEIDEPQDIIKVANIDLIFGNIFVDENDEFVLIDYEWVFDFEVPKSYVVWRSLAIFAAYHSAEMKKYNDLIYKNNQEFLKLDDSFSSFVHGESRKYFLAPKVGKNANFINLDKNETIVNSGYFTQLFIDQGNGISEESSIRLPVSENAELQEFIFELSNYENITNLRLDPLNDSCVIEIEKLSLTKHDGTELDLVPNVVTEVCSHHGKSYFFDAHDPQIYFDGIGADLLLGAKSLVAKIRFAHVGTDALHVSVKQTKTELDQTKSSLSWRITQPLRKIKQTLKGK